MIIKSLLTSLCPPDCARGKLRKMVRQFGKLTAHHDTVMLILSRDSKRNNSAHGFTLLEVLVATAILGIAVAVVLQLFSANLRALSMSEDYVKASTKAEVKMREILDDSKLVEKAHTEMTDDGYRIDVTITEVQEDRTMNIDVKLMEIDLIISWVKGTKDKSYALRSMKVIKKEI
jgi:prepilin-type N-terminal cleavage/methylation domain-containing protein